MRFAMSLLYSCCTYLVNSPGVRKLTVSGTFFIFFPGHLPPIVSLQLRHRCSSLSVAVLWRKLRKQARGKMSRRFFPSGRLPCYWSEAVNLPRTAASDVPGLRLASALPLPSRAGRRSEREFRGHAGGVLSSLPGLASFPALVPQCGKRFLRNSTFLRQHAGVKKRLLMVELYQKDGRR